MAGGEKVRREKDEKDRKCIKRKGERERENPIGLKDESPLGMCAREGEREREEKDRLNFIVFYIYFPTNVFFFLVPEKKSKFSCFSFTQRIHNNIRDPQLLFSNRQNKSTRRHRHRRRQ